MLVLQPQWVAGILALARGYARCVVIGEGLCRGTVCTDNVAAQHTEHW